MSNNEKKPVIIRNYTDEQLQSAINAVLKRDLNIRQASVQYGIPRATLNRRVRKRMSDGQNRTSNNGSNSNKFPNAVSGLGFGNAPRLGVENEVELVKYIQDLESTGYVHKKSEIRRIAFDFARKKNLHHIFDQKAQMAGNHWLDGFLRRHPEIKPADYIKYFNSSGNASDGDNDDDDDDDNNDDGVGDDDADGDNSNIDNDENEQSDNEDRKNETVIADDNDDSNKDDKSQNSIKNKSKGFTLKFEDEITDDEKKFYMKFYSSVDQVTKRKVHCTVCDEHIGTAPCQENVIRMHPVLKVTQCKKCNDFYNSGEFSKGEDGSELYCRWCGQGGEVYCCSKCPYVFCKNCIILNLSQNVVNDIEENENWNCFVCAPKIMWHLRAQHWALMNFIEKQKCIISSKSRSDQEIRQMKSVDSSTCCVKKTPISKPSSSSVAVKRPFAKISDNMSDSSCGSEVSSSKKRKVERKSQIVPKPELSDSDNSDDGLSKPKKRKSNDEVVCTPDVLSMLQTENTRKEKQIQSLPKQIIIQQRPKLQPIQRSQQGKIQISLGNQQKQHSVLGVRSNLQQQPPPLIIRNYAGALRPTAPTLITRKAIVGPRPPSSAPSTSVTSSGPTPIYHTINGYRIDLNNAAQQETFRLPNGKIIQVKRQNTVTLNQAANQQKNITTAAIAVPNQINSRGIVTAQQGSPAIRHLTIQQPHLATIRYSTSSNHAHPTIPSSTTITAIPAQGGTVLLNGTTIQQIARSAVASTSTSTPTTVGSSTANTPVLTRQLFSATPLGKARTQLQNQIFLAMEICQYLTGKIFSLTNSNAYKSVKNCSDVNDLYIHLSYLFTYAIGRFKGLQDKCLDDMKNLGFAGDASSVRSGQLLVDKHASDVDDDDIEIVEPKTTCIELDSDDNEDSNLSVSTRKSQKSPTKQQQQQEQEETNILIPEISMEAPVSPSSSAISSPCTTPIPTSDITNNLPLSGNDLEMTADILADMLGVDLHEGDSTASSTNNDTSSENKKPRKKMTVKPNPNLIKQMKLQQLERIQEIIRNDVKLKSNCSVVLENFDVKQLKEKAKNEKDTGADDAKFKNEIASQEEKEKQETDEIENDQVMDDDPVENDREVEDNSVEKDQVMDDDPVENDQEVEDNSVEKDQVMEDDPIENDQEIENNSVENDQQMQDNSVENDQQKEDDSVEKNQQMEVNSVENVYGNEDRKAVLSEDNNPRIQDNEKIQSDLLNESGNRNAAEKTPESEIGNVKDDSESEHCVENVDKQEIDKDTISEANGSVKTKIENENDSTVASSIEPTEIDKIITSCMDKIPNEADKTESTNHHQTGERGNDVISFDDSMAKSSLVAIDETSKTQDSLLESISDVTLTDYDVTKEDVAELLNSVENCSKYNDNGNDDDKSNISAANFFDDLTADQLNVDDCNAGDVHQKDDINKDDNQLLSNSAADSNNAITFKDCLLDCLSTGQ